MAGVFYPQTRRALADLMDRLLERGRTKERAVAAVVPHAGYNEGGEVSAAVYSRLHLPESVVILGPSHSGKAKGLSIMKKGSWVTPLGTMKIDEELAKAVIDSAAPCKEDPALHAEEHSIEVQLPFLQRSRWPEGRGAASVSRSQRPPRFVPILVGSADRPAIEQLAGGIAQAIRRSGKETLLIATAHFNHYESEQSVRRKDAGVIRKILDLNEMGLLTQVEEERIPLCGVAAACVGIAAAKSLGASSGTLVKYQTSAEATGERDSVVGFAGVLIR